MCTSLSFYNRLTYACVNSCLDKHNIYLAVKAANDAKKPAFPCKELLKGVDFVAFTKIDYHPKLKCNGAVNDGQYFPGYVDKSKVVGELCQFHVVYVCDKGGKLEMMEAEETQRDKFELCGKKIDGRLSAKPITGLNPKGKNDCEISVAEPTVVDQKFLGEI